MGINVKRLTMIINRFRNAFATGDRASTLFLRPVEMISGIWEAAVILFFIVYTSFLRNSLEQCQFWSCLFHNGVGDHNEYEAYYRLQERSSSRIAKRRSASQ